MDPLYELRGVSKQFGGFTALHPLDMRIGRGEKVALLGTSGAGKSTVLRLLNRLDEPSAGRIYLRGQDLTQLAPAELRRGLGYVIQAFGLMPHWTVARNIATVPTLLNWPADRIQRRVAELLEQLRLAPTLASRLPAALSGGQQQRVGLARALAADPPVLLMDEPFGALDPITRRAIRRDLSELPSWRDATVVLVTHSVEEAFALTERVVVLHAGRVEQDATPQRLLGAPASEFVARFVGDEPAYRSYLNQLVAP